MTGKEKVVVAARVQVEVMGNDEEGPTGFQARVQVFMPSFNVDVAGTLREVADALEAQGNIETPAADMN